MMGIRSSSITLLVVLVLLHLSPHKWGFGFVLGCQNAEREALLKFKRSVRDRANLLSSWNGDNCCEWHGISCDNATSHVHHLDLRHDYSFPPLTAEKLDSSLVELRHLKYLDLSTNFFGGRIPEFIGSMKHLRYLNLSWAGFTGVVPPSLGNLTRLRALDLSSSFLIVDNLDWIPRLLNLQSLDMGGINLTNAQDSMQALSKLPRLLELRLARCSLGNSRYLSHAFYNSTWLSTLEYLDLSYSNVLGPLPPPFANMSSLRFLDLSYNQFNGSISLAWLRNTRMLEFLSLAYNGFGYANGGTIMGVIGNLCKLKVLDFSYNSLKGELGGRSENDSKCITYDLERMDLSQNNITGTLPDWFGELKTLRLLNLENNTIFGQIPSSIGNLSWLEDLSLSSNSFNGSIPPSIGELSSLESLDLSHNLLSGHIPESLGRCMKLLVADLSSNFLEGVVSHFHLASLSRLDVLELSSNSLNFNFSSDWVAPFQLTRFCASSCRIQGRIPTWIQAQYKLQEFNLSHNEISGEMPDLSRSVSLYTIDLSHNRLTGPLTHFPSQIYSIDLSHNLLSGPLPQDLSTDNGEVGTPSCQLLDVSILSLKNNTLSGIIPHGCWTNSSVLSAINLSFNKLSGLIPMSIWLIPNLAYLNLNNNSFEGSIPPTFNSSVLVSLDLGENKLSGEIPSFGVKTHPYLQILRLRTNQLGGVIPVQLCSLSRLRILDLAKNNLTGSIPHCFGHLNAMSSVIPSQDATCCSYTGYTALPYPYPENIPAVLKGEELQYATTKEYVVILDLSSNGLVGSIPEEISNLSTLVGLNLSYNHLTGRIPGKIGHMKSLESLDLSHNNISGTIPASINDLSFLSYLNLSYNKLQGEIPSGRQLQTLSADPSIYAGNVGLCGDPLPKKCKGDPGQKQGGEQDQEQEEENDTLEEVLFYIVIMLGFGTGFWGVVGTLLLKKQWRYALFRRVEVMMDYLYVQVVVRINRMKQTAGS